MNWLPHKLIFQRGGQLQLTNHAKKLLTRSVIFVSKITQLGPDLAYKRKPPLQKSLFYVPEGNKYTLCLDPLVLTDL